MKKYESIINRNETDCARIVTLQNALYKEERAHYKLIEKHGKLQDDYLKAQDEITGLKKENEHIRKENERLSEKKYILRMGDNGIETIEPIAQPLLKFMNGVLKNEITELKDRLQRQNLEQNQTYSEMVRYRNERNELEDELTKLQQDYDQLLDMLVDLL